MIALGLLLILGSAIFGLGVISMSANRGTSDTLVFFGYHFDTSTAGVFIAGAVGGGVLLLGLSLLFGALRRPAHRRRATELEHSRHEVEAARQERDELLEARERQLAQERELHARHERELRRLSDSGSPTVADSTPTPTDLVAEPRPIQVREDRTTQSRIDQDRIDQDRVVQNRVDPDSIDQDHKEGFWHRIFGSPAHRS